MSGLSLIFIVVVMGGMMFFMNRQQKKQQSKRQEQLDAMQPGSEIVTIGGLHGILSSIDSAKGTIELDCEVTFRVPNHLHVVKLESLEVILQHSESSMVS